MIREEEIRSMVRRAAPRWGLIALPGDRGQYEIEGRDERGNTWQDPAALVQQYAYRSRPGARAEAVTGAAGASLAGLLILATRSIGDMPPELADWEADMYSRFKQRLHMREDGGLFVTTDKGHAFELRADGSAVLTASDGSITLRSKGGAELVMDAAGKVSTHDRLFKSAHFGGAGGAPTAAPGAPPALGDGKIDKIEGTDTAFTLEFTATNGGVPTAPGDIAIVTFAQPRAVAPKGWSITAGDAASATDPARGSFYASATTTTIKIGTSATLTDGSYKISVTVLE